MATFEQSFEREVLQRLTTIEVKLDSHSKAKETTYKNEKKIIELEGETEQQDERISRIENSVTWLVRTVAAAVITATVGIIFVLVQSGAGL